MTRLFFGLVPVVVMTLDALKHRDVSQVDRMLEGLVRFVARLALPDGKRAQINGMNERSGFY